MAVNLLYQNFPLLPETSVNENTRPGILILEYFQVAVTISSNAGDVEVPTALGEVKGVINLGFIDEFDTGDAVTSVTTDGIISTSAVTVRYTTASITNGAKVVRGFLVGTKSAGTALSFS